MLPKQLVYVSAVTDEMELDDSIITVDPVNHSIAMDTQGKVPGKVPLEEFAYERIFSDVFDSGLERGFYQGWKLSDLFAARFGVSQLETRTHQSSHTSA
jgi:hypothetical protein